MNLIAYWWLCTCRCCGKEHLSKRRDTKTCSVKCRKMRSRWLSGERTPTDPKKCQERYNKPPVNAGWGHHDDVMFKLRMGGG